MQSPPSELEAGSGALATRADHDPTTPFFGWRVLGAAFTGQFVSTAVTFSAFGVFVIPLSETFETSRGSLNYGFSIAFLGMGVLGPLVGRWLDQGHGRTLMVAGVSASGLALMGMSQATSLWQLGLLFCGVVAVGAAFFGSTPSMALAASWFHRRRGLALGIAMAGATVASFVAPAAAAALVDAVGWREALLWFGVAAIAIGVPVFWAFSIPRPESVGQHPDGDPPPEGEAAARAVAPAIETRALVRDPRLWLVSVGFALVFTSPIVMMPSLVPFAQDLGFPSQEAAYFFTAAAPFSLLGKLVFGSMADRTPPRVAIWIVVALNAVCWALLRLEPGYEFFLTIGAIYGLGIGSAGPLHGLVIARCFGPLAFGRAAGIGGLAGLPLIALVPAVAGMLYDALGSYDTVFVMQAVLLLLGGLLLSTVRIPQA